MITEKDINEFKENEIILDGLKKEYEQKSKQYQNKHYEFFDKISNWFDNFCETDEKIKELDFGCDNISNSISIRADKNNVEFTIVGEYYGDYTQYFECNICLDDIPFILNGEKSLWDFNPNTKEYRF